MKWIFEKGRKQTANLDISGVQGGATHFYGNDGVCVFKYLVTSNDPQRIFCLLILAINFCCFAVISGCYIFISIKVGRSSKGVSKNLTNNKGLQLKIAAIIFTDFLCWIPLTIVCFLHYGEVINAARWYPYFSIALLPINSVINPVLYNAKILTHLIEPLRWIIRRGRTVLQRRENSKNEDLSQQENDKHNRNNDLEITGV